MRYQLRLEHPTGVQAGVLISSGHAEGRSGGTGQLASELLHVAATAVPAVEGELADVAHTGRC